MSTLQTLTYIVMLISIDIVLIKYNRPTLHALHT